MKKIFITRNIPEIGVNLLKEKGYEVTISPHDRGLSKDELISEIKNNNYDGLITQLNDKVDNELLENIGNIKIIANYAVGFNNFDIEAAKKKNVYLSNCRGTSAQAVAEHTVALSLSVLSRIVEADKFVRDGNWKGWDPNLLMGSDLMGKTFGFIGTGNIGQMAAKTLHNGFDCKILYTDMIQNNYLEENFGAKKVTQEELLKNSDIVSLHVPLLKETTHLMNRDTFNLMKSSAILINTARGPVVDELALIEALKNKVIAGAGIDVFEFEPNVSKELLTMNNVVLTPHIASAKESARNEMSVVACKNIISVLEGGSPITEVK